MYEEAHRPDLSRYGMYTVAWICALSVEMAAAQLMLDKVHEKLPRQENDTNTYVLGRMGEHNVVIACLPDGAYGTINAANVATNLRRSFPAVKVFLMVGIGGGAPSRADLRLGDVVVAQRVMQHDLGKYTTNGGLQHTAVPKVIPHALGTVVTALRATLDKSSQMLQIPEELLNENLEYSRPSDPDLLFHATYEHQEHATADCASCDPQRLLPRRQRKSKDPMVHYGAIASGNQLFRDSITRDKKAKELNVICFEMESAGIMDVFDCLPIRGICDYSDSHKNKKWQKYAALAAAVCAKGFLGELPVTFARQNNPPHGPSRTATLDQDLRHPSPEFDDGEKERRQFLKSLEFSKLDSHRMGIKDARYETCQWFLDHPDFKAWIEPSRLREHHGFLWIRGKPGAGKSTIMNFIYHNLRLRMSKEKKKEAAVVAFFFHARGENLEKSVLGMYRSLLVQLFKAFPDLKSIIDHSTISSQAQDIDSVHFLKDLFRQAVKELGQRSFTCVIDALDECDEQQVMDMVEEFEELAEYSEKQRISLRICFSSRHYPYIEMRLGIRLVLEDQPGHTEDLSTYMRNRLRIKNAELVEELRPVILGKASGVFLWVVLVVDILNEENRRGRLSLRQRLEEVPSGLSDLFKDMLKRDAENMNELLLCVLWILYSIRPLQPAEYYHALGTGLRLGSSSKVSLPDATAIDAGEMFSNCVTSSSKGLAEISKSEQPVVQFIHESVRDFLIKDGGLAELWPDFGYDCSLQGHDKLKKCCELYINLTLGEELTERLPSVFVKASTEKEKHPILAKYPFLEYACRFVLQHANIAAEAVPQDSFLNEFPLRKWIIIHNIIFELSETRQHPAETSMLYILATQGCPELIQACLEQGADMNAIGGRYRYPLFAALTYTNLECAATLIGIPLSTSQVAWSRICPEKLSPWRADLSFGKKTPLTWASGKGQSVIITQLLKSGAKINELDRRAQSPLFAAITNGRDNAAVVLLDNGADWKLEWPDERILLHQLLCNGFCKTLEWFKKTDDDITEVISQDVLQLAAGRGCLSNVNTLIRVFQANQACDLESSSSFMNPALISASRRGHVTVARALILAGADVNHRDSWAQTSLLAAVANGHIETAQELIAAGANTNAILPSRVPAHRISEESLLAAAAFGGHWEFVEMLLKEAGGLTAASIEERIYILTNAVRDGQTQLVKKSIAAGADVNARDGSRRTALWWAAHKGLVQIIFMLVAAGVDVNSKADAFGLPALHEAVSQGHLQAAKALLERRADPNLRDNLDRTALHYASNFGITGLIRILLQAGVNVDAQDKQGKTALHRSVQVGRFQAVKDLLDEGANSNVRDDKGRTALHYCHHSENIRITGIMIQAVADVNARDNEGNTALHRATLSNNRGVLEILINGGADVNARTGERETALDIAIRMIKPRSINVLREYGNNR